MSKESKVSQVSGMARETRLARVSGVAGVARVVGVAGVTRIAIKREIKAKKSNVNWNLLAFKRGVNLARFRLHFSR